MALSDLQQGSRGMDVRIAQQFLNEGLGQGSRIDPDGVFGPLTLRAVQAFQRKRKLEADGAVGPLTWAALRGAAAPAKSSPVSSPSTPLRQPTSPVAKGPVASQAQKSSDGEASPNPALEPPWLKVALAELGIHERTEKGAARIIQYHQATTLHAHSDQVAWCSSFVNWCLAQVGLTGTRSAAAASWAAWGVELKTPRLGCIVQLHHHVKGYTSATGTATGNHVAFFMRQDAAHIRLLGGNQSDSVKFSDFPLAKWSVKAYRWPPGA